MANIRCPDIIPRMRDLDDNMMKFTDFKDKKAEWPKLKMGLQLID